MIGALLVLGILACQILFGIIRPSDIRANFLSIAWPYIVLVAGFFIWHLVRAPYKLNVERENKEKELEKYITGIAGESGSLQREAFELIARIRDFAAAFVEKHGQMPEVNALLDGKDRIRREVEQENWNRQFNASFRNEFGDSIYSWLNKCREAGIPPNFAIEQNIAATVSFGSLLFTAGMISTQGLVTSIVKRQ